MQYSYSAIAVAALSFSSVFAAPTPGVKDVPVAVSGVVASVPECVDSDLSCLTKKDLLPGSTSLPAVPSVSKPDIEKRTCDLSTLLEVVPRGVVSGLESLPLISTAADKGKFVAGGLGADAGALPFAGGVVPKDLVPAPDTSAILVGVKSEAAPLPVLPRGNLNSPVAVMSDAVGTLKISISTELFTITTVTGSAVVESIVPTVQTALKSIAMGIHSTVLTIAPAVTGTVVPLAIGEVEALISVLTDLETIISDIEGCLGSFVGSIAADARAMITPELAAVLAVVMPLISPVTSFAFSVASTVSDHDGEGNDIRTAAFQVAGGAGTLLSPVTGVLGQLLSK